MSDSKQINFFIVPDDWAMIGEFFKKAGVHVIKVPLLKADHLVKSHLNQDLEASQVYLTNEDYKRKIVLTPQKTGYYVDVVRSSAIEFSRGGFYPYSDKILHRGRLYSVFKYYNDDGILTVKDSDFKEWADVIYKSFKKNFLKKTKIDNDFLFSENAIKWMLENKARVDAAGVKAY
jgi:hypothetical protein